MCADFSVCSFNGLFSFAVAACPSNWLVSHLSLVYPGEGVREIVQHPPRDGLHITKRSRATGDPRQRPWQSHPAPALVAVLIGTTYYPDMVCMLYPLICLVFLFLSFSTICLVSESFSLPKGQQYDFSLPKGQQDDCWMWMMIPSLWIGYRVHFRSIFLAHLCVRCRLPSVSLAS